VLAPVVADSKRIDHEKKRDAKGSAPRSSQCKQTPRRLAL